MFIRGEIFSFKIARKSKFLRILMQKVEVNTNIGFSICQIYFHDCHSSNNLVVGVLNSEYIVVW